MLSTLLATLLIAGTTAAPHDPISNYTGRDRYLVGPAPYPAYHTDSPDRIENGRLWHSRYPIGSRTPIREQLNGRIGAAAFGAPEAYNDQLLLVPVDQVAIAISPWQTYNKTGFDQYQRAQNIWLREQGWVLKVRTHVNPRYQYDRELASTQVKPRATIRLHRDESAPTFPSRMRVDSRNGRIWRPFTATKTGLTRVIEPDSATTQLTQASSEQ
jgi:hypothetical protein